MTALHGHDIHQIFIDLRHEVVDDDDAAALVGVLADQSDKLVRGGFLIDESGHDSGLSQLFVDGLPGRVAKYNIFNVIPSLNKLVFVS